MHTLTLYSHLIFETLAYFVGFRIFLKQRQKLGSSVGLVEGDDGLWLTIGAILGAALGCKLVAWLYDPLSSFGNFPDPVALMQGKTVVGGLLGGLVGVEVIKKMLCYRHSTGDLFVVPCLAGIIIGRIGCFLSGLSDRTHGIATSVLWAWDYGDGIMRHPTQIYEIIFAGLLWYILAKIRNRLPLVGDQFKCFMLAYLSFRLAVDSIKPIPWLYLEYFSGIQLACIAGLIYYARHGIRIGKSLIWAER